MHTMDGKDTGSKLFVGGGYAIVQLQSAITPFFPPPPPFQVELHTFLPARSTRLFIPFEKLLLGFCPLSFRCYSINHDWNIMYTPRKENNSRITMHTRLTSYLLKRKKDEEKWEITNASTINI